MAAREVVHRCPVCGEPLKPTLGEKQYECGCCVMRYPAEVVNARHEHKVVLAEYAARCMAETDWDVSALTDDWGEDTYRVHVFSCPSCKVSLLSEYGNHVTTCPCCGASGLKPDPFFRVLRPNWIAPFLIDRETAVEKVRSFYELRPFLPGAFTRRKHTRAICRLYVPMWLMDFGAEAGALYQAKSAFMNGLWIL